MVAKRRQDTWRRNKLSPAAQRIVEQDAGAVLEIVRNVLAELVPGPIQPGNDELFAAIEAVSTGAHAQTSDAARFEGARIKRPRHKRRSGSAAFRGLPVWEPMPIPEHLQRFAISHEPGGELLNATEASRRLGVARGTIYNRAVEGSLLAWRQSGPGLYVPAEQIRGPNDIVPGLKELRAVIGDPRLLWSFLSRRQPFADGVHRPIDLLAAGRVDDVVGAARSYGAAPT